jgi:uncharacterized metal-binding protein
MPHLFSDHFTCIIEATKSAEKIIALDGCALSCAKCLLEKGGFANIDHVCKIS